MDDNFNDSVSALEKTDFRAILGAPLTACVDAQAQAASATADYIEKVGFRYNNISKEYETTTITFRYYTEDEVKTIIVPLITVMPVPYLQIRDVNMNFSADLSVRNGALSARVSKDNDKIFRRTTETEGNSNESTSFSSDLKVNVNIKASSADMPMGVSYLLQVLQNSIDMKEIQ